MRLKAVLIFLLISLSLLMTDNVKAISFTPPPFKDSAYLGKYVSVSVKEPIEIKAGETKEITVKIKNVGKAAWEITGKNYVSAYTVNKNYRASVFANSTWISASNPAKITKRTISGETAEIKLKLKAPTKTGTYREDFYLAAENKTWIKSSYFYLDIKVIPNTATIANDDENKSGNDVGQLPDEAEKSSREYKAHLSAMTAYKMTANGGDKIGFIVMYTNVGSTTWDNFLWQEAGSTGAATGSLKVNIADNSWLSPVKIFQGSTSVKTGESTRIEFYFRAPRQKGEYVARFQLTANNHTLDGGTLEIPVTVLQDAPYSYQEPVFTNNRILVAEPSVRIGLYKATEDVKFKSDFSYEVYAGSVLQGTLFGGETATMRYSGGNYYFNSPNLNFTAQERLRLVPYDFNHYFTLLDYDRYVSWKGNKNFNAYRGIMEFKYSPKSDAPYVINELPMDSYIAGIAETSNGAAMEYIKAILVAARSYAYYHLNNGVPADQRTFDLYATTADQLYLGYNSEILMPRVVQAARVTNGEMVTYNSQPVITPYFGHSDGKTRTWKEVWGGTDKEWLQPVTCIYDEGQNMFGHGVGMSAWDASQRADKDGWTYNQLLQYYYKGTSVEKIY
ncbi:MAG TPA: SpoIID/LytB domain-containing protein [Candidatus Magasanikbacteria bacterium]|nr:SpoIID/LytB domain-containing protein [Candidatus Magasanikbacteria bacterium]